jgi:hypothetical protein
MDVGAVVRIPDGRVGVVKDVRNTIFNLARRVGRENLADLIQPIDYGWFRLHELEEVE